MASTGVSQISQYSAAVHALQDLVTDKIDQLARCKPVLRSQLNAEITSYMAQLRADYRKLEEEAEELHSFREQQQVQVELKSYLQTYEELQRRLRLANQQVRHEAEKTAFAERRALLAGANPLQGQRKLQSNEDAVDAAQDVTSSLQRTRQLLAQELNHTGTALEAMETSHTSLGATTKQYNTQAASLSQSHRLLGKMRWHNVLDWLVLWGGVAFFALVVLYILQKRLIYFVPSALTPRWGAHAPVPAPALHAQDLAATSPLPDQQQQAYDPYPNPRLDDVSSQPHKASDASTQTEHPSYAPPSVIQQASAGLQGMVGALRGSTAPPSNESASVPEPPAAVNNTTNHTASAHELTAGSTGSNGSVNATAADLHSQPPQASDEPSTATQPEAAPAAAPASSPTPPNLSSQEAPGEAAARGEVEPQAEASGAAADGATGMAAPLASNALHGALPADARLDAAELVMPAAGQPLLASRLPDATQSGDGAVPVPASQGREAQGAQEPAPPPDTDTTLPQDAESTAPAHEPPSMSAAHTDERSADLLPVDSSAELSSGSPAPPVGGAESDLTGLQQQSLVAPEPEPVPEVGEEVPPSQAPQPDGQGVLDEQLSSQSSEPQAATTTAADGAAGHGIDAGIVHDEL